MTDMAGSRHYSLSEAKQRLGELVKRAAYGGETVVLEFRGKPIAAIVRYVDMKRDNYGKAEYTPDVAAELKALRERGAVYRTDDFDSVEELRKLRAGEAHEFPDLPRQ
jgi:prevent-host-death family protein